MVWALANLTLSTARNRFTLLWGENEGGFVKENIFRIYASKKSFYPFEFNCPSNLKEYVIRPGGYLATTLSVAIEHTMK